MEKREINNQEAKQRVDECYRIANDILSKYSNLAEEDRLYIESVEPETDIKEYTDKEIEKIQAYLKRTTGKELNKVDIEKLLNTDVTNRKELSIDPYMQKIIRILNQTKVVRRSSDKPMMTPRSQTAIGKSPAEAHLTTRGVHQEQVGDLSAEIAEALGANVELARVGGKHHDDGHTNSGHTGERIATMIGIVNNCGYIVHNALSADMLISEGIIKQIIDTISVEEHELSEERKEEIIRDIWYIFDIQISHNGEGKERIIKYNPNKTVEQIKEDKNRCYTEQGYDKKIVPGSKEAAIVAFADRICYVRTDMLDGVNLGILKQFDNEYLKYIGMFAMRKENSKLSEILDKVFANEEILEQKLKNEFEVLKSMGIDLSGQVSEDTIKRLMKTGRESETLDTINKYLEIKSVIKDIYEASTNYGIGYVSEIPIEKRADTIANMIKDISVRDVIEYSSGKDYVGMSPAIAKAFFGVRLQNLEQIVKFTRRKYEKELLPQAEYKVHRDLKKAILDTGIAKQYLASVNNEEFELSEEQIKARKKYGVTETIDFKNSARTRERRLVSTKLKDVVTARGKYKFERKACHNFIKLFKYEPERLEEIYQNALKAVDDITLRDVETAVKDKGTAKKDILTDEYEAKIEEVRKEISSRYSKGFSQEEKETFTKELANRRKNDREDLLAAAISLEYVAGMTDGTLLEATKIKGYLTNSKIKRGYKREAEPEDDVKKMGDDWNQGFNDTSLRNISIRINNAIEECANSDITN